MNVLFVYPLLKPAREVYVGFHHGIGYLSAVLKKKGHATFLYAAYESNPGEVAALLTREKIDLVAITSSTIDLSLVKAIVKEIVEYGPLPILIGGIHATLAPEEIQAIDGVTGVCRGEGEEGLLRVVDSLEQGTLDTETPGFWFTQGETWISNPPGPPTALEGLPFPDRDLFNYAEMLARHSTIIGAEFLASRGCPFSCTYCSLPALTGLYAPHRFCRRRAVEDLMDEIESVRSRYPVRVVGFHDDIFTLDKVWLAAFCEHYSARVRKPFWCNSRTGCITPEDASLLRKSGCIRMHVAVESGSSCIRENVLNRRISDEEIIETFAFLKKAGIKTLAFNMIGLPFETEETIKETIALNRRIRPDRIHLTMFRPFPGTALYTLCAEKGWLRNNRDSYYEEVPSLEQPQISNETLVYYFRNFLRLVYG